MKTLSFSRSSNRLIGLLLGLLIVYPALGANECEVLYSYTTSSGSTQSQTINLDAGEAMAISQSQIRYVKNKKSYPIRVEVTNLWPPYGNKWVSLDADEQQDPPSGTYGADVTLYNVECGGTSIFPTPEQMVNTLKAAGVPVEDIASGLQQTFNQTGAQIADLLDDADFTASQIAEGLKEAFNASGEQVAQWMSDAGIWARYVAVGLEDAFSATGEQVAQWMRDAGYNAIQVTQGLIEAFSASASQAATWLSEAGYTLDQIAQALIDKFNTDAEAFIEALQYQVCGVAGCPGDQFQQLVQVLQSRFNQSAAQAYALLMDAGYALGEVVQVLRDVYNASAQQLAAWMQQSGVAAAQAAQALQETFNASAQQVAAWLQAAGYSINAVAQALKEGLNASVNSAAAILTSVFNASADSVQAALEFAGYSAAQINQWLASLIGIENVISGYTQGAHANPITTPRQQFPLHVGLNEITIRGAALPSVTSISGLPSGARVRIVGRGTQGFGRAYWTYLHVEVSVSTRTAIGTAGRASLHLGAAQGPGFGWVVQARPGSRGGGITQPPRTGGGGTARTDLVPINIPNVLYKVGTATTTDANGDIFTALDPFNDSAHCQGIPQGSVNRRTNQQTSNTARITVPDIRWGVENTSSVDVTSTFTVQLLQNRRVVASQQVNGLAAGERAEFTFRRPQSQTTVARVGLGNGCYHAGLRTEGWNDNSGFTVSVDTGRVVDEASESNNNRAF